MIVTFYSFKGGVGRSMAVANVARWLQQNGLGVAVVDWDLEAPGLESFFVADPDQRKRVRSLPGLMDLLSGYMERWAQLPLPRPAAQDNGSARNSPGLAAEQLAKQVAVLNVHLPPIALALQAMAGSADAMAPPEAGGVWLLTAGARDAAQFARYANNVQDFDWRGFYGHYNGEAFFEWLRQQLDAVADITLIDCRTGVTEMGGVCTRHMADIVVALSAPNEANLAGLEGAIDSLMGEALLAKRAGRPLQVVSVPARVDDRAENVRRNDWRDAFMQRMGTRLQLSHENMQAFWDMKIPYVPFYSFEEKLVIGELDRDEGLDKAYKGLGFWVAQRFAQQADRVVREAILSRREPEDPSVRKLLYSPELVGELAWGKLREDEWKRAGRLLLHLVSVAANAEVSARALAVESLPQAELELVRRLEAVGLVHAEGEGERALLRLGDARFLEWPQLRKWIEEDREFLAWRQRLDAFASVWSGSANRDEGLLIGGDSLRQADKYAETRFEDLLPRHVEFIGASKAQFKRLEFERLELAKVREAEATDLRRQLRVEQTRAGGEVAAGGLWRWRYIGLAVVIALGVFYTTMVSRTPSDTGPNQVQVNAPSPTVDALITAAQDALKRGAIDTALALAEKIVHEHPRDARGYLLRGQVRALQPDSVQPAIQDLQQAIELGGLAEAFQEAANLKARGGDLKGALLMVDAGLGHHPESAGLHLLRGQVLEGLGERVKAVAAYTRAIELEKDSTEAHFARARVYVDMGKTQLARADWEAILALPGDNQTKVAAAALLAKLGDKPAQQSRTTVFVQFFTGDPAGIAEAVVKRLKGAGFDVKQPESLQYQTQGDVRYYFLEDESSASTVKSLVETAMAEQGRPAKMILREMNAKEFPKVKRGVIEVWLPPAGNIFSSPQQTRTLR